MAAGPAAAVAPALAAAAAALSVVAVAPPESLLNDPQQLRRVRDFVRLSEQCAMCSTNM